MPSRSRASEVFEALASVPRLAVLSALKGGTRTVASIQGEVGLSQPAVSNHLVILRRAGLIEFEQDGKYHRYGRTPLAAKLMPAVERILAAESAGGK